MPRRNLVYHLGSPQEDGNPVNRTQPWIVLVVALIAAGCAGNDQNKARVLDDTLKLYGSHVRWGHFRTAAQFLDPEKRPEARQLEFTINRLEQVRITGYQLVAQPMAAEADHYIQVVELRLANRHTAVERTVRDRQVWRWEEESGRWWLTSGLPDISRRE